MKGAGGGFFVYSSFVATVDPEPVTKTISVVITAVGGGIICGGSIFDTAIARKAEKDKLLEEITDDTQTAIQIFLDLENNPPEQD